MDTPPPTARPATSTAGARPAIGDHLRSWRQHRRLSQLDLAQHADVSTRHLSCVETGRATPSREMVLRLASRLEVPLRERNALLVAAGYAPMYRERPMSDPHMASARRAVDLVLKAHEPFPALAVDRHWNLVSANAGVARLLAGVDPSLLQAPVNVLRLSLHPRGMAPRILNLSHWARHVFERLRQQIAATSDPVLVALLEELQAHVPAAAPPDAACEADAGSVVVELQLAMEGARHSFISTTMVFGTPIEVTLQELAIESFFPADEATALAFRASAG